MRVLFTGASSFTGFHFINALAKSGAEVYAMHTKPLNQYDELRLQRFKELSCSGSTNLIQSEFGSSEFLSAIKKTSPSILCVHGAYVSNYKSLDFDINLSIERNCNQLHLVFKALKDANLKAVVYTGSVFEGNEGIGSNPNQHFSPYGLSKSITGQIFQYYCELNDIQFGKFVIPNPFGTFEEKRFVYYLVSNWFAGKTPVVNTPLYIRDNIPVNLLAAYYSAFLKEVLIASDSGRSTLKLSPTGIIGTNQYFAERVSSEFSTRVNKSFQVKFLKQVDFSEPLFRVNDYFDANIAVEQFNETEFWDNYVNYYLRVFS